MSTVSDSEGRSHFMCESQAQRIPRPNRIILAVPPVLDLVEQCRAALEAASKSQARSDDVRAGFELLFSAALPEHSEKRIILNDFVKALSNYAQLGRYESFPALLITKSEAEFIYTSTLGLFSFIGRRLSKLETTVQAYSLIRQ